MTAWIKEEAVEVWGVLVFPVCFEAEPIGFARRFIWGVRDIQLNHDSRAVVFSWGQGTLGNVWSYVGYPSWGKCYVSSRQRPEIQLNILWCTDQLSPKENVPAPSVNDVEIEKWNCTEVFGWNNWMDGVASNRTGRLLMEWFGEVKPGILPFRFSKGWFQTLQCHKMKMKKFIWF